MSPEIPLQVGPLTAIFQPEHATLRSITFHGEEVLRRLYVAARGPDWATATGPVVLDRISHQEDASQLDLEVSGHWVLGNLQITWKVSINLCASGEIDYHFSATSETDALANRVGICVLHPISDAAFDCDGTAGKFPGAQIAPWPLATDIRAFAGPGVSLAFSGPEAFEMEDQRNWGDHSFKTYVRPQHLPKPFGLKSGETLAQSVKALFRPTGSPGTAEAAVLPKRKLPLGLLAVPDQDLLAVATLDCLATLSLDHLRAEIRFEDADWERNLKTVASAANLLGISLQVAANFSTAISEECARLSAVLVANEIKVTLLIAHSAQHDLTPPALVTAVREHFGPQQRLAAGTDAHFCELNRNPPSPTESWLPAFPLHPQAHLTDDATLLENAPTLGYQLASLALYTQQPAAVGPVTLGPRPQADARQASDLAAIWLENALQHTSAAKNLHSLTLWQTHGPGGVTECLAVQEVIRKWVH